MRGKKIILDSFLSCLNLFNKKMLFTLVTLVLGIGIALFFTDKKLDKQGICWAKGRALSNEELYKQAIQSYIAHVLSESLENNKTYDKYKSVKDVPGWGSEVWQFPPMTEEEIKSKILYEKVKSGINIKKVLGFKKLYDVSELKQIKIQNNVFSFAYNLGDAKFFAKDCCKIYTAQQINRLKNQDGNKRLHLYHRPPGSQPQANPNTHYLSLNNIYIPAFKLLDSPNYTELGTKEDVKKFEFKEQNFHTVFVPLNACGTVMMYKQDFNQ